MEENESRLEKVEKIDIKKSISGFYAQPSSFAYESQEYCPEHVSTGTEKHHVSHVLTFFSFMAYNVKRGTGVKAHLLNRAIHHLAALREFVEDQIVSELVTSLYESARLEHESFPKDGEQCSGLVRAWLSREQETILRLAGHYKKMSVFDGLLPIPVSVGIKKRVGTAIRDLQGRHHLPVDEHQISGLFQGYFNNKMTLLIFLIQAKSIKADGKMVQSACGFLDDMYRHMLADGLQKRYHLVFLWLRKFFLRLPKVNSLQREKAVGYIRSLYSAFGIHLLKTKGDKNENAEEAF